MRIAHSTRYYLAGFIGGLGACDTLLWLFLHDAPTRLGDIGFFVAGLILMAIGGAMRATLSREAAARKTSF